MEKEKKKRKRHTRWLQRRVMQRATRRVKWGNATRGKGVAKAERGNRARATLEEEAKRGDKGDAWQRCDATEARRDEGVGTRGHVDGGEGKGQQMKKEKDNKDARGGCSVAQRGR